MMNRSLIYASVIAITATFLFVYFQDGSVKSISPTAHYTSYVWGRNQMSDKRLQTHRGFILYYLLEPLMRFSKYFGEATIEEVLLARHTFIDDYLDDLLTNGKVTQVVEIAAGLSPRGLKFIRKYGDKIRYVEADLTDMAILKRSLIQSSLEGRANHQVFPIDAIESNATAELSIQSMIKLSNLDTRRKTVFITEGLVNYFDEDTLFVIWRNIAQGLSLFADGTYVSDIHLNLTHVNNGANRLFQDLLSIFVKRKVYLHFNSKKSAEKSLIHCGFKIARIHDPLEKADVLPACSTAGARKVNIIVART